jgi:uncharacterized membrane protein
MESFKTLTLWVAAGSEAAAMIVIGLATVEAAIRALGTFFRHSLRAAIPGRSHHETEDVRLRLGRWLSLGLEFLLAADILRTAVAPTWEEIGQLAAIAVLRTGLNFFLQKEIEKAETRERHTGAEPPLHPAGLAP